MKWRDKNRFKQMKQKVILIFSTSKFKMRFSLPYLRCTNHHFWFFSSEMKSFNLSRPKQNHQVHSEFGWIFLILKVQFLHPSDCFVLSLMTQKKVQDFSIEMMHINWSRWLHSSVAILCGRDERFREARHSAIYEWLLV